MPAQPYWLQRLPEITGKVRTLQVETIDRRTFESIFQLRRRRAIELMHFLGSHRGGRGFVLERRALLERLESFETAVQYQWVQVRSPRVTGRTEVQAVNGSNGKHHSHSQVVIQFANEGELIEKLLTALHAIVDSRQDRIEPREEFRRLQYDRFEQAVKALSQRSFQEAQALFAQACAGPDERIRTSAEKYLSICNHHLVTFEAKSFEEHYTYGVMLLNARDFPGAHKHFELALRLNPEADYVYYALAAWSALRHDMAGVYSHLSRAIQLQPRNRMAARYDPDFEEALKDPDVERLVNLSSGGI